MPICDKLFAGGVSALLLLCGTVPKSQADSFIANFTCTADLGRALYPLYTSVPGYSMSGVANGFTYSFGTGSLAISQAAGFGNAELQFPTTFTTSGDFVASVVANRQNLGMAESGMMITDEFGSPLMDIFFHFTSGISANVFPEIPNPTYILKSQTNSDTSTSATFRIVRRGNKLVAGEDSGSGFVPLNVSPSDAGYGVPVKVSLFLIEEYGDTGAHQGAFSSVKISAASLGRPCFPPSL